VGPEPLGRMVRRLRLEADLTLERLSVASGISDRTLSDIERGAARGPQHRTVLAIARALDLPEVDRTTMARAAREGRRRVGSSRPLRLPLPRDLPDFTGRVAELAAIGAALIGNRSNRSPVVLVTGPPGYGKTSLAVHAATLARDAFPTQLYVELEGLAPDAGSPDALGRRLVQALTGAQPRPADAGAARRLLTERPVLLVLDGAVAESQVRAVLPSGGPSAVLVTCRRSLAGLDGAERISLDRFRDDEAVELLAAVLRPDQVAGADLAGLAQLCDNVPLALRIAGNRLASRPAWTVDGLVDRLSVAGRRLELLTAGDVRFGATVERSYVRAGPAAQRLFRRLALLDGGPFDAGLAAVLVGDHVWTAENLLDELADLGLVQPSAGNRYTVPALLRLFARTELVAQEAPTVRRALRAAAEEWLHPARRAGARRGRGRLPFPLGLVPEPQR
jgi:transcriptional regulator with XRE-family HTH domain